MRPLFFALLLAAGCTTYQYQELARRFEREYSTDRPAGHLPGGARVVYPAWLAEADRPAVLGSVESYIAPLRAAHPGAPWSRLEILIHPACPFRAPWRAWVRGCRHGALVVVSWARLEDGSPRADRPLPVLPHEVLHWIAASTGQDSRDGSAWMAAQGALDKAARAGAAPCPLGAGSVGAARGYVYRPWDG